MVPFLSATEPVDKAACPNGTHQCRNGYCVAVAFLCDGENDCNDEEGEEGPSDEDNCPNDCEDGKCKATFSPPGYPNVESQGNDAHTKNCVSF